MIFLIDLLGLYSSFSRGPWVSFFVAFILYNLFVKESKKREHVILLVLLISVITLFQFESSLLFRITSILDFDDNKSNALRLLYWWNAIDVFLADNVNTIFGIGLGKTGGHSIAMMVTESGILKRLVEGGIILFFTYYIMIIYILFKVFKIIKSISNEYVKTNMMCVLCMMLLILTDDITLQITENFFISSVLWMCVAYLFYFAKKQEINHNEKA